MTNKKKQPELLEKRIKILDEMLKRKFASNYESVREAFLHIDTDYDLDEMIKSNDVKLNNASKKYLI